MLRQIKSAQNVALAALIAVAANPLSTDIDLRINVFF
jgi:hypothetical protein